MTVELYTLSVIALVALLAPYVASLIPGRPVPETVFVVFAGAILGPNTADVVFSNVDAVELLSELGLAFLFLLAGYEIDLDQVKGPTGRHACASWAVSLAIALAVTPLLPLDGLSGKGNVAFAIAMTTTAFGTLAPILRERGLTETPVGRAVSAYGATGEVLPVLAMAILLSSHSKLVTALILVVFALACLVAWRLPLRARRVGSRLYRFLVSNASSSSQTSVRAVVLLLVFLVAVPSLFGLDIVLGAFAAGFILRSLIPEGDHDLESKLDGIAFGFLIPVFFFVSGTKIDLHAVTADPALFVGFMVLLLLVRAVPVFVSLCVGRETRQLDWRERITTALYCSCALPIIVAVTSVAQASGDMTSDMASVLVAAGACTVFVVPFVTSLIRRADAAHPLVAAREIATTPSAARDIMREHRDAKLEAYAAYRTLRQDAHAHGRTLSSADYLAERRELEHRAHERRELERRLGDRMRDQAEQRDEQDEQRGGRDE